MANTTTFKCVALYYIAAKKNDDYVCKDNLVDANSLTVKRRCKCNICAL